MASIMSLWALLYARGLYEASGQTDSSWLRVAADALGVDGFASARNRGGDILRFGGLQMPQSVLVITNELWRFSGAIGWSRMPSGYSPSARTRPCSAVFNGSQAVLMGGRFALPQMSPSTYVDYNDVWAMDTGTMAWRQLHSGNGANVPGPRSGHSCVIRGEHLIVTGGATVTGNLYDDAWAFHIPTATWKRINTSGTGPGPVFGSSLAYIPSLILSVAGLGPVAVGDAVVLHGGRTYGSVAMTPLAAVQDDTYLLLMSPAGRPGSSSGSSTTLTGTWVRVQASTKDWAGPPPRSFAPAFVWSSGGRVAVCMQGGADYVGYGDHITSDVLCTDLTSTLAWTAQAGLQPARRRAQNQPFPVPPVQPAVTWWAMITRGDQPIPRQRHALFVDISRDGSSVNVTIFGGASMDYPLGDMWTYANVPLDSLPSAQPAPPGVPWSLYRPPTDPDLSFSIGYLAFGGLASLMIILAGVVMLQRANRAARQRALERAVAAERLAESSMSSANRRALDRLDGRGPGRGLDPFLIQALPTFEYQDKGKNKDKDKEVGRLAEPVVSSPGPGEHLEQVPPTLDTATSSTTRRSSSQGHGSQQEVTSTAHADHGPRIQREPSDSSISTCTDTGQGPGPVTLDIPGQVEASPTPSPRPSAHSPKGRGYDPDQQTSCPICMTDYAPGDVLRILPCLHRFHARPCLDTWLAGHTTCPLCKLDVAVAFV